MAATVARPVTLWQTTDTVEALFQPPGEPAAAVALDPMAVDMVATTAGASPYASNPSEDEEEDEEEEMKEEEEDEDEDEEDEDDSMNVDADADSSSSSSAWDRNIAPDGEFKVDPNSGDDFVAGEEEEEDEEDDDEDADADGGEEEEGQAPVAAAPFEQRVQHALERHATRQREQPHVLPSPPSPPQPAGKQRRGTKRAAEGPKKPARPAKRARVEQTMAPTVATADPEQDSEWCDMLASALQRLLPSLPRAEIASTLGDFQQPARATALGRAALTAGLDLARQLIQPGGGGGGGAPSQDTLLSSITDNALLNETLFPSRH